MNTTHVRINLRVSPHLLPRLLQVLREQVALYDGVGDQVLTADVHHSGEKVVLQGANQRAWMATPPEPDQPAPPPAVRLNKRGMPVQE